ncbi:MscS Mechanosensitive ion channel [Desulfatibacillum aliphaticivorans]|uniref:Mechanosensing system component YbdG n=1 Tax=Desulfatibacillum aliphaticivorans TaxID=218208 RepID=B8FIN3_DESAL|nr:mechanosensitive ion channel domain-containing protein [Desulfatibacillum aliphaticivorans]ACL04023.1 MscS Mechanosensitive ion channel [Desulfatibacillum aliphaticivorans]
MAQLQWIEQILMKAELSQATAEFLARIIVALATVILSAAALYAARRLADTVIPKLKAATKTTLDDVLVEHKVFRRLSLLAPALVVHFALPLLAAGYPQARLALQGGLRLYFIITGMLVITALINALHAMYQNLAVSREIPLTSIVQVVKIAVYFIALILGISVVFNKTPVYFISGLGAMTAVLLLVFKDPLLGFVAGIQLIYNKMLKHRDWIEMPKYGADGDVEEITLTTVKVRNFDKTISTVPTYALISDSFKNWRGMQESGGRRIKRAIHIDMNTIKFCTEDMMQRFSRIRYISKYMEDKGVELAEHNAALGSDGENKINCRQLTNIGTFRAYVSAYLKNHPLVHPDMTFLVRQLPPGENGLPLEIYVFCIDKVWANYEAAQSDIFDHLLAILPEFDLGVFQNPTGRDMRNWGAFQNKEG